MFPPTWRDPPRIAPDRTEPETSDFRTPKWTTPLLDFPLLTTDKSRGFSEHGSNRWKKRFGESYCTFAYWALACPNWPEELFPLGEMGYQRRQVQALELLLPSGNLCQIGGTNMKIAQYLKGIALIGALALLAGQARADSVSTEFGPLYYPSGATLTSLDLLLNYAEPVEQLDYTFADGTGYTVAPSADGNLGDILFSTPITSITFSYVWSDDDGYPFDVTFNFVGAQSETFSDYAASDTDAFTFNGDVTSLQWIGGLADEGTGGITSLSYTLDGPPVATPEPSTWLLLALGLALVGTAFVWNGYRATSRVGTV
jgi:PEP-CTERM motif